MSKIALAMIVKGDDSEAIALEQSLKFNSPHVDGIFITITQPNKAVEEVALKFGAVVSNFEWCNDFSKARNFNFAQVPKDFDYILWCDADDAIRGLNKLHQVIEEHPSDIYVFNYLYAFDEQKNPIVVHAKSQVIKNDGCVEWAGALHEDFKENRSVERYFVKNIERIHLSNEDRFEKAKDRNIEVSKQQIKDSPEDPRSYWNYANSLKADGKDAEAITIFDKFLELSKSNDEKYIARLRRAESYFALGLVDEALDECRYGIGTKPDYPDAYHLMGFLLMQQGKWMEASKFILSGLVKNPPYYSIIVYNPRDYDFIPMNNLAKCYFHLNRPDLALPLLRGCLKLSPKNKSLEKAIRAIHKEIREFDYIIKVVKRLNKITDNEKLLKELNNLPLEYQAHPSVCNIRNTRFIKKESSGKDLVFFCGFTEEEWTPETAKTKGIGGSEEAVIWLSKLLVQKGWNVTVYNNCGHIQQVFDGVLYKPFWTYNYRDKQDVTILWRATKPLDWEINSTKVFVDLHDVIPAGELNKARVEKADKIFVKSKFHRSLFPNVSDDKFVIIPNGIDSHLFDQNLQRDDRLLVNTSSPDRSLEGLLDCFELVKQEVPDVKLKWAYGWTVFDIVHKDTPEMMDWKTKIQQRMKELGVEELGRINHSDVAKLYLTANIFAYPSEFGEIDCISLSKAQAAGAYPITTDFAALGEKTEEGGVFIHSEKTKDNWCPAGKAEFSLEDKVKQKEWVEKTVSVLLGDISEEERNTMREKARNKYDWNKIVDKWLEILN